jgi:hypothetical protein
MQIFQIREINLNQPVQKPQGFRLLIGRTVPDNRNGQPAGGKRFGNNPGVMAGSNELNVMYAGILKPEHQVPQPGCVQCPAPGNAADFGVLAIDAAKIAAAEKDTARTACSADTGLLSKVRRRAYNLRQRGRSAVSRTCGLIAPDTAVAGAIPAEPFHCHGLLTAQKRNGQNDKKVESVKAIITLFCTLCKNRIFVQKNSIFFENIW